MKKPEYNPLRMSDKNYAKEYAIKMQKYVKYLQKIYRESNVNLR